MICQSLEHRALLAAVTWDGGGDGTRLDDPFNWSTDVLPTSQDDATIASAGSGSLTLSSAMAVRSLSVVGRKLFVFEAGTLTTSAPSTAGGGVALLGGTLNTSSTFDINGLSSSLGVLTGGGEITLRGLSETLHVANEMSPIWSASVTNLGTLTITTYLTFEAGNTLVNAGTLEFNHSPLILFMNYVAFRGDGTGIRNTGRIHVINPVRLGTTFNSNRTIDLAGTVDVDAGQTFEVALPGVLSASFNLASRATLDVAAPSTVNGIFNAPQGFVEFSNGSFAEAVIDSPMSVGSISILTSSKVRLNRDVRCTEGVFTFGETTGPGKFTIDGLYGWGSGAFANTGGVVVSESGYLQIGTPGNTDAILRTTLTNFGTMGLKQRIPQSQGFRLGLGANIVNHGLFDVKNESEYLLQVYAYQGATASIANHGLLRISSSGTGLTYFSRGVSNSTLRIDSDGVIDVSGQSVSFQGASGTIGGQINIGAGAILTVGASQETSAVVPVYSAVAVTGDGELLAQSRIVFQGSNTVSRLRLEPYQFSPNVFDVSVSGRLTVTDQFMLGKVNLIGTGTIAIAGSGELLSSADVRNSTVSFDNRGTFALGNARLRLSSATFRNFGTLTLTSGSFLSVGGASFVNDGILTQSGSATAQIENLTHRSGTLTATTLRLVALDPNFTLTHNGRFLSGGGGSSIRFEGNHRLSSNASVDSALSLQVSAGRFEYGVVRSELQSLLITDAAQFRFVATEYQTMKISSLSLGGTAQPTGTLLLGYGSLYVDPPTSDAPYAVLLEWARLGTLGGAGLKADPAQGGLVPGIWPITEFTSSFPYELSSFSLSASALVLSATTQGDVNGDRVTDFADLVRITQNYGHTGRGYDQGNLNYDAQGLIDFGDLLLLAQSYQGTATRFTALPIVRRSAGSFFASAPSALDFVRK